MTIHYSDLKGLSATDILNKLNLMKAPVDLEKLCELIQIPVSTSISFEKTHSGEISLDKDGSINIWVNSLSHSNRQRFTLAHELGHLVNDIIPQAEKHSTMSFEDPAINFQRSGAQKPEEYRANAFAAELLMPEELIVREGKKIMTFLKSKLKSDKIKTEVFIEKMAERFGVSNQAMEIRLTVTGIID